MQEDRGINKMKKCIVILFIFCFSLLGYLIYQNNKIDKNNIYEMAESAGVKISALTEMTDNLVEDDEIAIVDTSPTPTTKRIVPQHFFQLDIDTKTADPTAIVPADGRKILTNDDAGAAIEFDLPECVASPGAGQVGEGWWIVIYMLDDTGAITIDPHANDTIGDFASGAVEAGDSIVSDTTIGTCIKLACMNGDDIGDETDAYNFYSMGYVGTWTAED